MISEGVLYLLSVPVIISGVRHILVIVQSNVVPFRVLNIHGAEQWLDLAGE